MRLIEWFSVIGGAILFVFGSFIFTQGYNQSSSNYSHKEWLEVMGLYAVVFGLGWLCAWSQLYYRPKISRVIYYVVGSLGISYWIMDVLALTVFHGNFMPWAGWDIFMLIFTAGLPLWLAVASLIIAVIL